MSTNSKTLPDLPNKRDWLSYCGLWLVQALNSFNDKAAQFLIITLAVNVLGKETQLSNELAIYIVLPFVLFAPMTGWLTDRFPKVRVLRLVELSQLFILLGMFFAIQARSLEWAIVSFIFLAIQSTFLSPAKKGLIYETVGPKRVGVGTGALETGTYLFAIVGMISGSLAIKYLSDDPWESCLIAIYFLLGIGILCLVASIVIKPRWLPKAEMKKRNHPLDYLSPLKAVFTSKDIAYAAAMPIFFGIAASWITLVNDQFVRYTFPGDYGDKISLFHGFLGLGILSGATIGSLISIRRIRLDLMPLILGALCLLCVVAVYYHSILFIGLPLLSLLSGLGVITMIQGNAYIIRNIPDQAKGRAIAGVNMLSSAAGALTSLAHKWVESQPFSIGDQYWMLLGVGLIFLVLSLQGFGREFIRFLIITSTRMGWGMRTLGRDRVPEDEGLLIVSNHVTWLDSGAVNSAIPRKVRFLMAEEYSKYPLIGKFTSWFDVILVTPSRAKEAMQRGSDAIKEGSAVCIFPEGRLTRSGQLNEIKRGFHLMAKKAEAKIVPLYMDGLWGTITSFERGKYFKKWPYWFGHGVTAACGEPIEAKDATPEKLRVSLERLSHECLESRLSREPKKRFRQASEICNLMQSSLSPDLILANARQIQNVNFHTEKRAVILHISASLKNSFAIWSMYQKCTHHIKEIHWFGEAALPTPQKNEHVVCILSSTERVNLKQLPNSESITVLELFDIERATTPEPLPAGHDKVVHCPALADNGVLLTLSLPFEVNEITSLGPEFGIVEGTFGRLLPGGYREGNELYMPRGAKCDFSQFELDEKGFVKLKSIT